jgi:hypothetical protein
MKRSRIKPSLSEFELEFRDMKPLVIKRSLGICEVSRFVRNFLERSENDPTVAKTALEMMASHDCGGRATHVHHRKYRSRGGSNSLANLIHICVPCHDWIHSRSEQSNILGLSLHTGESEEL